MYISLIDKLSNLDKKRINNYLTLYGVNQIDHLDASEWLEQWSHSKQKLYHALGDNFIVEVPTKIEKSERIIDEELSQLKRDIIAEYREIVYYFCEFNGISRGSWDDLLTIMNVKTLKENAFAHNIKVPLKNGSVFQLQKGTKVIRAINKIINAIKRSIYYTEDSYYKNSLNNFMQLYKQFENSYSIILNEKFIQGTLCFSIHPLDFITMSDNSLNWNSCMSWTDNGCYRVGTIEMMNSNNTICVYIKSNNKKYNFSIKEKIDSEDYCWNNKKWRQLYYVTKDILCCGKSYPFCFDKDTQIFILSTLKNIITKNAGWEYTYGPELYQDMIHIHSKYRMDNNRHWIQNNLTTKHNILFDTNSMYNDMLNDINFKYYCYRNKVKRNKIISVSGKANCICCNKSTLIVGNEFYEETGDYNERYEYANRVLCKDCWNEIPCCVECNVSDPTKKYIKIVNSNGFVDYYCKECFEQYCRICPCCGELFNFEDLTFISQKNKLFIPFVTLDYENLMTKTLTGAWWMSRSMTERAGRDKEFYEKDYKNNNVNGLIQVGCCIKCHAEILKEENKGKIWEPLKIFPYQFWFQINENKDKRKLEDQKVVKIIKDPSYIQKLDFLNMSKPEKDKSVYTMRYSKREVKEIIDKDFN